MSAIRRTWAVAKKDMRVYYLKGPVVIFGLLFPGFLFLAFAIGRNLPAESLVPGLVGMSLFFTSSAVTPAVLPFETRTRTLERLLTAPLSLEMLLAGDALAAFLFGLCVSLIPALVSLVFIISAPVHLLLVRLPMIFFSGVFLPVAQMPAWGQYLAAFSPLTYTTEALRAAFGQPVCFPPTLSLSMLCVFAVAFWVIALTLHRRNMSRRLWL